MSLSLHTKTPGCPPVSSCNLQYADHYAFLAVLTHDPLGSGRYIRSAESLWEHRQMTAWQISCSDKVVCPKCMHSACSCMYFVGAVLKVCDLEHIQALITLLMYMFNLFPQTNLNVHFLFPPAGSCWLTGQISPLGIFSQVDVRVQTILMHCLVSD